MATSYIGADVDCRVTELAVRRGKRVVSNFSVPTTIPALAEVLRSIRGPKLLTIEEGNMAGWLARNLRKYVDELIVCDPRPMSHARRPAAAGRPAQPAGAGGLVEAARAVCPGGATASATATRGGRWRGS